jgi:pimeloyl-ACP methyl ester carboxylesterase
MKNGFLDLDGIQLYYCEKNSSAPYSLFFIHGNSVSHHTWRKQWDDPLFSACRLVAIDLPAHGASAPAPDPAATYTLPALGALLARAVKQLAGNKPYIVAGISLATNIIAEMLAHDVKPAGLVLASSCIVGKEIPVDRLIKPGTHVAVVFTDAAAAEDVKMYGQEASLSSEEDLQLFLEDYFKVAAPFRSLLGQSIAEQRYNDQLSLLRQRHIPTLFVFGKDEKVVDPDYLDHIHLPVWKNQIVKIPGASHLVQIDQPAAFNTIVSKFMRDVFTAGDS